jgi:H(+)-transporting ATP synthase subunit D
VSSAEGVAATKGLLLRFREQLQFVEKGREVLKMKRERLAMEVNQLLDEIKARDQLEKEVMAAYGGLKEAYCVLGYQGLRSIAQSVEQTRVGGLSYSVVGIAVPTLQIERTASVAGIPSTLAYEVSQKFVSLLPKIVRLSQSEAEMEKLVEELKSTNRKVSALEQIVIPSMTSIIQYIENRLYEESLEEFIRTKHVRESIRKRQ